jgi:hypothetical protein
VKTEVYRTLLVVLCGCETWSLTKREEHRLRLFERGVLKGMFGTKGEEGENCIISSFTIRTLHQTNDNLKERNRLEYIGLEGG